MTDRDIITVTEAAEILPFTADQIRRRIAKGTLPGFKLGRRILLRRSELDGWLALHVVLPPADPPTVHKPRRWKSNFWRS